MTHYDTWVGYSGAGRSALAAVLVAVAAAVAYAGVRLPLPLGPAKPRGRKTVVLLLTAWVLAIAACLAGLVLDIRQALRAHLIDGLHSLPPDRIFPVTLTAAGVTFFIIAIAVNGRVSGWTALTSAAAGAMAGPVIFEFPFDLIVIARTPPIPPHPALHAAIFFGPLFLIEIITLSLLTLLPVVRLRRATFVSFALMLAVFAGWALTGFGYPSAPVPIAFNVASKILAFATALTLFLPRRAQAEAQAQDPQAGRLAR